MLNGEFEDSGPLPRGHRALAAASSAVAASLQRGAASMNCARLPKVPTCSGDEGPPAGIRAEFSNGSHHMLEARYDANPRLAPCHPDRCYRGKSLL